MNKLSAGATFLLCLFLGIIFDQVAIGILAGLVLGATAGKVTALKSREEAAVERTLSGDLDKQQ